MYLCASAHGWASRSIIALDRTLSGVVCLDLSREAFWEVFVSLSSTHAVASSSLHKEYGVVSREK